jgi:hypothetical protein
MVGPNRHLLVVEPLGKHNPLLRHLEVHGPPPLLPQQLLGLERALFGPVGPYRTGSWQPKVSKINTELVYVKNLLFLIFSK